MENKKPFEVGDEVVTNRGCIGKVIRITPKTKRIVVSFGRYEEKYHPDGSEITNDVWYMTHIKHLTPEIRKELEDKDTIYRCKEIFKKTNIDAEQARKILDILEQSKSER